MTANKPAAFCEDTALSIAERTFSTEVDEQLASDIIQYAQRLHSLYAAPRREEQKEPDSLCVEDDGCPTEKAVLQRFWRKHHQTVPDVTRPVIFSDEDHVYVPRGLIAAACSAIKLKAPAPMLQEELRRYTVGDLSRQVDPGISQLVEALEAVMEFGCDPKSNRGKWAQEKAESVLAAYHKGDES